MWFPCIYEIEAINRGKPSTAKDLPLPLVLYIFGGRARAASRGLIRTKHHFGLGKVLQCVDVEEAKASCVKTIQYVILDG